MPEEKKGNPKSRNVHNCAADSSSSASPPPSTVEGLAATASAESLNGAASDLLPSTRLVLLGLAASVAGLAATGSIESLNGAENDLLPKYGLPKGLISDSVATALTWPEAPCHRPLPLSSSASEGTNGDVQSMTVTSLPLCFFSKLRNLLNPLAVVSLGDRAAPENLLPALPGGALGVGATLFSARSSRFFRTRAASASSTLSMDWSRELSASLFDEVHTCGSSVGA